MGARERLRAQLVKFGGLKPHGPIGLYTYDQPWKVYLISAEGLKDNLASVFDEF